MRYFLLFPFASLLLGRLPALGQTHRAQPATDNSAWMDSVQHLSLPQQVEAVRARAWRDTLLAPYQPPLCRVLLPAAALRPAPSPTLPAPTKPRSLPLVYVVNGQAFYKNDAATIGELQRVLTSRPIRQLTLLHDAAAAAIYGSRGANGVVVLSSTKAKHR